MMKTVMPALEAGGGGGAGGELGGSKGGRGGAQGGGGEGVAEGGAVGAALGILLFYRTPWFAPGFALMAACDDYRYRLLGCTEYHDNCTDNLRAALQALGLTPPGTPSPLNLFMNIPWSADGALAFESTLTDL